jgi:hypothetical protein
MDAETAETLKQQIDATARPYHRRLGRRLLPRR